MVKDKNKFKQLGFSVEQVGRMLENYKLSCKIDALHMTTVYTRKEIISFQKFFKLTPSELDLIVSNCHNLGYKTLEEVKQIFNIN